MLGERLRIAVEPCPESVVVIKGVGDEPFSLKFCYNRPVDLRHLRALSLKASGREVMVEPQEQPRSAQLLLNALPAPPRATAPANVDVSKKLSPEQRAVVLKLYDHLQGIRVARRRPNTLVVRGIRKLFVNRLFESAFSGIGDGAVRLDDNGALLVDVVEPERNASGLKRKRE